MCTWCCFRTPARRDHTRRQIQSPHFLGQQHSPTPGSHQARNVGRVGPAGTWRITRKKLGAGVDVKPKRGEFMATKATVKYPTAVELQTTGFGRPDKDHSAVQEACAETTLFIILKSGFLTRVERDTSCNTGPLIDHLIRATDALNNYDFSRLRQHDKTWESQADIPAESKKAMLACLFHYDLDVSLLMRYLGGNHIGAHRDVESTAATLLTQTHCSRGSHLPLQKSDNCGMPTHFQCDHHPQERT